ncbi:MAG: hypothetical protein ACK559_27770, partial [bacterium]
QGARPGLAAYGAAFIRLPQQGRPGGIRLGQVGQLLGGLVAEQAHRHAPQLHRIHHRQQPVVVGQQHEAVAAGLLGQAEQVPRHGQRERGARIGGLLRGPAVHQALHGVRRPLTGIPVDAGDVGRMALRVQRGLQAGPQAVQPRLGGVVLVSQPGQ